MVLFSQRKGIRPVQKAIQRGGVDSDLRNKLWSALKLTVWDHWQPPDQYHFVSDDSRRIESLVKIMWVFYFKQPVDTIPKFEVLHGKSSYDVIREYFFASQWWEMYDFIEFVYKNVPDEWKEKLKTYSNTFLETENAAYRIVNDEIAEISDKNEIEAIETGLSAGGVAPGSHLQRALELLSDRSKPDYRNSIKESISAVEALCRLMTGNPKAVLSDCIKRLHDRQPIHPAFEQALSKLYAYTSDVGGIRHSLTDENENPSYADAKFMLVSCSAFVNYMVTKATELNLKLPSA